MKYYKAVILEILDDRLIVLTTEGNIISIHKKADVCIGQKIYILEEDIYIEKKMNRFKKIAIAGSILASVAVLFVVANVWFNHTEKDKEEECTNVLIQGNYSIEFQMDESDNIIDIKDNKDEPENYNYWIGKKFKEVLPEVYDEVTDKETENETENSNISYKINSKDEQVYTEEIEKVITDKKSDYSRKTNETKKVKETKKPKGTEKSKENDSDNVPATITPETTKEVHFKKSNSDKNKDNNSKINSDSSKKEYSYSSDTNKNDIKKPFVKNNYFKNIYNRNSYTTKKNFVPNTSSVLHEQENKKDNGN